LFVGDIPKMRNAKVMRRIVRAAYLGENSAIRCVVKPGLAGGNQTRRRVGAQSSARR
jgi:hypothetical protein